MRFLARSGVVAHRWMRTIGGIASCRIRPAWTFGLEILILVSRNLALNSWLMRIGSMANCESWTTWIHRWVMMCSVMMVFSMNKWRGESRIMKNKVRAFGSNSVVGIKVLISMRSMRSFYLPNEWPSLAKYQKLTCVNLPRYHCTQRK